MPGPPSARQGAIRVHVMSPGVVEVVFSGFIAAQTLDDKTHEFYALLRRSPSTVFIADATGMQSFEPKVTLLAAQWLNAFKAQGGQLFIVVSASSSVRMVASTLSFAAGIPIKTAASSGEAMSLLSSR